ncbi:hypothetical protein LTR29_012846 [Friedmanniomyces endolithicus]|nr:hypothetical protein LTR29_012846 [Friedmanniomyces endolithicus]
MSDTTRRAELIEESKLIYCCTRNLRDGLWSGLVGTLQKYGYTEANRTRVVAAFKDAVTILIQKQGSVVDFPSIESAELGLMVYLGLEHMLTTTGANPWAYSVCKQVIDDFAVMEMGTIGHTLGLAQDEGEAEEVDEDFQKVCKAIEAAEGVYAGYGSPFGYVTSTFRDHGHSEAAASRVVLDVLRVTWLLAALEGGIGYGDGMHRSCVRTVQMGMEVDILRIMGS